MPRSTIACILIALLICSVTPASAAPTVAEQIASLKAGQKIKVELLSGETTKRPSGFGYNRSIHLDLSGKPPTSARVVPIR